MRVRKSAYTKVGLHCMALAGLVGGAVHARARVATWAVYVTRVKMATQKLYCYGCGKDISENSSNRYNMFGYACEEALPIFL